MRSSRCASIDAADDELPDAGLVVVEDAETGEQLLVDSGDPLLRARLRAAVAERETRGSPRECAGPGCPCTASTRRGPGHARSSRSSRAPGAGAHDVRRPGPARRRPAGGRGPGVGRGRRRAAADRGARRGRSRGRRRQARPGWPASGSPSRASPCSRSPCAGPTVTVPGVPRQAAPSSSPWTSPAAWPRPTWRRAG